MKACWMLVTQVKSARGDRGYGGTSLVQRDDLVTHSWIGDLNISVISDIILFFKAADAPH